LKRIRESLDEDTEEEEECKNWTKNLETYLSECKIGNMGD
jgi:hypothetical protein